MSELDAKKYLETFLTTNEENVENIKNINNILENAEPSTSYLNVDLDMLPCGEYYKPGTQIKIRAAKVSEIQSYSVVENSSLLDITEKMSEMLKSCTKFIFPNKMMGSYKDIKDGDRIFLIFMIRELTFQSGNSLAKDVVCEHCKNEFKIPFRATNSQTQKRTFVNFEMNEKIKKYFNDDLKCFVFNVNSKTHKLAPPTIGINEIFIRDIKIKTQLEKNLNVSFLKIAPFLLWDRNAITDEGLKAKEKEFTNLSIDEFQVINKAVDYMVNGVKELKQDCPSCGLEVHTDMMFPDGAASIFIVSDPFANLD